MTGKTALVTTGAIIPFEELIKASVSRLVLNALASLGFDEIIVQYGKGEKAFQDYRKQLEGVTVKGFDFTTSLGDKIDQCDLVISHAGTGSILDALRAHKPLIVVINANLMDNHQQEIADEFRSQGYLLTSEATEVELARTIQESSTFQFAVIPPANTIKIASIIDHEADV
jgi:beta-1,4-N-acetylglucosaminyltransferase